MPDLRKSSVDLLIPETRFHFKTEVLRFGRVGCTRTYFRVTAPEQKMQHEARFYSIRGKKGLITCVNRADGQQGPVVDWERTGESHYDL